MYSLDKYIRDTLMFTNSLVVKLIDIGISMNEGVIKKYKINIPSDKREWKYFLNLAGEKHFDNKEVLINTLETNTYAPLTKELLSRCKYTRDELLKNTGYYLELTERYPDELIYINGCLYPVDIDIAIEASDGTILAYNDRGVEYNEYSLIPDLEKHIKNYLHRWHVRAYRITDELYIPALLSGLFASLPAKIQNIRLEKILTNEVHSFHLEHFFRSNLGMWDEIRVLKEETKFWLYKNLKYLIKNVGKEDIFKIMMEKIFLQNNIGIGEYVLKKPIHGENVLNQYDLTESSYKELPLVATLLPRNDSYIINQGSLSTIESIVTAELTTLPDITIDQGVDKIDYTIRAVKNALTKSFSDEQKTKVLDIDIGNIFSKYGTDILEIVLSVWLEAISNDSYNLLINTNNTNINSSIVNEGTANMLEYVDPNTNTSYHVTPKVGFLMLIKLLMLSTGNTGVKINNIMSTSLLTKSKTKFANASENIYNDGYVNNILEYIKNSLPTEIANFTTVRGMGEHIHEYVSLYENIWLLDSNSENALVSANLKLVLTRAMDVKKYSLLDDVTSMTIDEMLLINNVTYNINTHNNILLSIYKLIETFTGVKIDPYIELNNINNSFISILNKLTSYTTQVIKSSNSNASTQVFYNNTNIIRSRNGLINVMDGVLLPLELGYPTIASYGDNVSDSIGFIPNYTSSGPLVNTCEKPIVGIGMIYAPVGEIYPFELNNTYASITNAHIYDATLCEYEDNFLLGVSAVIQPLETNLLTVSTGGNDIVPGYYHTASIAGYVEESPVIVTSKYPITGSGVIANNTDKLFKVDDVNNTYASITNAHIYDATLCEYEDNFLLGVSAVIQPLETNLLTVSTGGNDSDAGYYHTASIAGYVEESPAIVTSKYPITGSGVIANNTDELVKVDDVNNTHTSMSDTHIYDATLCEYEDNFLLGVSAVIQPLETNLLTLTTGGNADTRDFVLVNVKPISGYVEEGPAIVTSKYPITGSGVIANNTDELVKVDDVNNTYASMLDTHIYDATLCEYEDNFLLGVSAVIQPLETNLLTVSTGGNDVKTEHYKTAKIAGYVEESPVIVTSKYPITGSGVIANNTDELVKVDDVNNTHASMSDIKSYDSTLCEYEDNFLLGVSAEIQPLETNLLTVSTGGNDSDAGHYHTASATGHTEEGPVIVTSKYPITGSGVIANNTDELVKVDDVNNTHTSITNAHIYDATLCEYEDNFLLGVSAEIQPLETNLLTVSTGGNDDKTEHYKTVTDNIDTIVTETNKDRVSGAMLVSNDSDDELINIDITPIITGQIT